MKVFTLYDTSSTLNTYLVGPEKGDEAIIIDPGHIDMHLLDLAEASRYYIRNILVTHAHDRHIKGIKTLMKIFNADIYSKCPYIFDFDVKPVNSSFRLNLAGLDIEVIEIPGHSEDSVVYRINNIFFTGDVLSAGKIGSSLNSQLKKNLQEKIEEKILSADEDCLIMPAHGPPSTVAAEKKFNPYLNSY